MTRLRGHVEAGLCPAWYAPTPTCTMRGFAHSVETYTGQLVGGLYFVAIGRRSTANPCSTMRPTRLDCGLAARAALCRHHKIKMIDCQQNTGHLASLWGKDHMRRGRAIG